MYVLIEAFLLVFDIPAQIQFWVGAVFPNTILACSVCIPGYLSLLLLSRYFLVMFEFIQELSGHVHVFLLFGMCCS